MVDEHTDADTVRQYADQLRQYATHFAHRDWNYTRDLGDLQAIIHDRPQESLKGRLASSWRWLTRKPAGWEREFKVGRIRMARHALRRDKHLPDGILDGGSIITHWEETGEYLQYVQPTVGEMLADWMEADPDSGHAQRIAAEMKRINDSYAARLNRPGSPE